MSSTTPPPPPDQGGSGGAPGAGGPGGPPPPPDGGPGGPGGTGGPPPPPSGEPTGRRFPTKQGGGPAGVGKRIGAYLIDSVILIVALLIIFIPLGISMGMGGMGDGGFVRQWLGGLLGAAIFYGYFVFMEGSRGQTLGKMMLGMAVVGPNGAAIDYAQAAKRRFPFIIGSLIPIPILNSLVGIAIVIGILVTVVSDEANRGFHDKWADTGVLDT